MGLGPKSLDGGHDGGLLIQEGYAQFFGPGRLLGHHGDDLRKRRKRLDAQVPIHCIHGIVERIALQIDISLQPSIHFQDLSGERCRYEDLSQQRIRIQRDWGKHLVKLCVAECLS
jgi:hypothetical protein